MSDGLMEMAANLLRMCLDEGGSAELITSGNHSFERRNDWWVDVNEDVLELRTCMSALVDSQKEFKRGEELAIIQHVEKVGWLYNNGACKVVGAWPACAC